MVLSSESSKTRSSIPTIDFSSFMEEKGVVIGEEATPDQLACAQAIDEACRNHGFLHIRGFGLTTEHYERAFAASKELFDLPNKKETMRPWKPAHNMGYAPFATESTNPRRPAELKEAYGVRYPPTHINDFSGCPPTFVDIAEELLDRIGIAARRYAIACAVALGLPSTDFFAQTLQEMDLCTIRFLHYPPCDIQDTAQDDFSKPIRVGEHTDFGAYTFLLLGQNGAEGLQIKPVDGGDACEGGSDGWMDVVLPEDDGHVGPSAIVNTGALMARWTNDVWRATAHRVVVPSHVEASRDRYSVAMFVDPDAKALVESHGNFISEERPNRYDPITGLDFLMMKLNEISEVNKGKGSEVTAVS